MPGGPGDHPRPKPRPPRPPPPRPLPVVRPAAQPLGGGGASGGGGLPGGAPDANPELLTRGSGPNPEWIMRDFTPGMHVNANRDAIADHDLWWCENVQPLASGNLSTIIGTLATQAASPVIPEAISGCYYVTQVQLQNVPYVFMAFTSGNAYIVNTFTLASTKIMTNLLNVIGNTYVVNYMGKGYQQGGFLVIDPNGYWDYGVTAVNTLTKIGATTGTSIATYAGRVWIGNQNTLSFTDINSYNSFAGAGGSATLSDEYLLNGITCLYAANNYLYILGGQSVDVLSNVTVNAGVTSFSRVNVIQGLGVTFLNVMTVIGFARGLVFQDLTGLYLLAGATPERISERIQAVVRSPVVGSLRNSVGLINENGELCLLWQIPINDSFSHISTAGNRALIFVYQRHRWWVHSNPAGNALTAGPITGSPTFATNYGAFQTGGIGAPGSGLSKIFGSGIAPWQIRTKLWDGGRAFTEKQGLNVSFGAQWNFGTGPPVQPGPNAGTGVTFTIDSELQTTSPVTTLPNVPTLYVGAGGGQVLPNTVFATQVVKDVMASGQAYGSQFIGMTWFGVLVGGLGSPQTISSIEVIAMRGKQENNKLE